MNTRIGEGKVVRTAKRILGFAGLASLALVCAGATWAQSMPAQTGVAVPVSAASAKKLPAAPSAPKGQTEAIKVHGHWTIEVKNPNGTVASRQEFENAIAGTGPDLLTGLISGEYTAGGFYVNLDTSAGAGSGNGLCGNFGRCTFYDSRITWISGAIGVLTYTPNPTGGTSPSSTVGYTLSGTVAPSNGGTIVSVNEGILLCANSASFAAGSYSPAAPVSTAFSTTSAQTCSLGNSPSGPANGYIEFDLTSTTLPTPQTVTAPQSVSVTVVITFGSSSSSNPTEQATRASSKAAGATVIPARVP